MKVVTGSAFFVPKLKLECKLKLRAESSIFTAETIAILEDIDAVSLLNYPSIAIFSDAKSVLNSIANFGISSSCHVLDVVNKVS